MKSSILTKLANGNDNPYAKRNKARFQEYLDNAVARGIYGSCPLVLYTGTNALYELAVSKDEADRQMYHKLGQFIINSPLK